jgi:hypothetical protein
MYRRGVIVFDSFRSETVAGFFQHSLTAIEEGIKTLYDRSSQRTKV